MALLGTVAYAAVQPTNNRMLRQLGRGGGRVKITNSRAGKAILGMRDMMPGDRTKGTVVIGNGSKKRKARFYVALSKLVDRPGPAKVGRLSHRLVLTVKRISRKRRPQLVYTGRLRDMPMVKLGTFRPKEKRTYLFEVAFPDRGAVHDNHYQLASTSVSFTWYARTTRR